MVDESPLAVAQEMANVIRDIARERSELVAGYTLRYLKSLYDRWNIAAAPRVGSKVPAAPEPLPPMRQLNAREEVWLRIYAAVANALGVEDGDTARAWADKALVAFDERFPPA